MTSDIAIRIEGLSKSYLVGHESAREGYQTLRDTIARTVKSFGRKALDMAHGRQIIQGDEIEEFWALQDVSFEVERGEAVGIIGRNGAGKSTLLKVLSRITEPTRGRVTIVGRVASLLEVGTGFHPELTGRENIFLNGAILGMTRQEIKTKFDEIVDFAEVQTFLDTPVKRYSSGMYVRLAFAVAAHLDPEILVIDEVLAVGDIAFQKKCLGKMQNVAKAGRTVLFVSHNLPAVLELTQRAVMIERGQVAMIGGSKDVVSGYLRATRRLSNGADDVTPYRREMRQDGYVDIRSVSVCGLPPGAAVVPMGENVFLDLELYAHRPVEMAIVNVNILNEQLEAIATVMSADDDFYVSLTTGAHRIRCDFGRLPLVPGDYLLSVGTAQTGGGLAWDVLEALPGFSIDGDRNANWIKAGDRPGVLFFEGCKWRRQ